MQATVVVVIMLSIVLLWSFLRRQRESAGELAHIPIASIRQLAKRLQFQVHRSGSELVLTRGNQQYSLEFIRRKKAANTPSVAGTVLVTTQRPGPLPFPLPLDPSDRLIVGLNRSTALMAWIPGEEGKVVGIARVTYHKDVPEQWDLYVPMMLFAAASEPALYRSAISSLIGEDSASTPPETREKSPSSESFALAGKVLERAGGRVTIDNHGLRCEIPWREGAGAESANQKSTRFSQLTLRVDVVHPVVGSGTSCELRLPVSYEGEEADTVAFFLNIKEVTADDAPPLFGAWSTIPESGVLVFRSFVPSALWPSVAPANLAAWFQHRSQFAPAWIREWKEEELSKWTGPVGSHLADLERSDGEPQ